MKLIKKYNKALEATYEHAGLKEDRVVCPLDTESLEISSEQVDIEFLMKEYAKLKCQELLEIVAEKVKISRNYYPNNEQLLEQKVQEIFHTNEHSYFVNKNSILKAVDLNEFIK